MIEQGPSEEAIIEGCAKRGVALPEAIRNAPELLIGLDLYYDAFLDLGTCRNMGGQIPWTAIREYAAWLGLSEGEDFDRFVYLMKQLDAEWYDIRSSKEKGNASAGSSGV